MGERHTSGLFLQLRRAVDLAMGLSSAIVRPCGFRNAPKVTPLQRKGQRMPSSVLSPCWQCPSFSDPSHLHLLYALSHKLNLTPVRRQVHKPNSDTPTSPRLGFSHDFGLIWIITSCLLFVSSLGSHRSDLELVCIP